MYSSLITVPEYLSQDSRVMAIDTLHEQLVGGFASFYQAQKKQWSDRELEPAHLHHLFDLLAEEVSMLLGGLDVDDHELAMERANDIDPVKKKYHRSKSITALLDRYSILVDTLREGAHAAGQMKDWVLTDTCSELAHRFEEFLWFMVVHLNEPIDSKLLTDK